MAGEREEQALVLRRVAYGDADWILDLLLSSSGRQRVFARSARRSAKRFSGGLEPLVLLRVSWKAGRGEGLGRLAGSEALERWERLTQEPLRFALASHWVAQLGAILEEGQGGGAAFELGLSVLRWLGREAGGRQRLLCGAMRAELRLLHDAGFWPEQEGLPDGEGALWFSPSAGVVRRSRVLPGAAGTELDADALELLALLLAGRFPAVVPEEALRAVRRALDSVWALVLDHPLKTRALVDELAWSPVPG